MGTCTEVKVLIKDSPPLYMYTMWSGHRLLEDVRDALKRGESRWNDPPYLIRIIFSQMIRNSLMDTTGFGITTKSASDSFAIIVDTENQEVTVGDIILAFEELINKKLRTD